MIAKCFNLLFNFDGFNIKKKLSGLKQILVLFSAYTPACGSYFCAAADTKSSICRYTSFCKNQPDHIIYIYIYDTITKGQINKISCLNCRRRITHFISH